jgi:serine phosphatase RsbU (regulator of sigma subunit)
MELYEATRDSLVVVRIQAQEAELEAANQRLKFWWLLAGSVLLLGFAGGTFWALRQKRKHNQVLFAKNTALEKANTEIRLQQDRIERQHQDIVESITYARRIQEAVLPTAQQIAADFQDSFVLYKPKDIVSGDFFWYFQGKEWTYLAAVDCTGHGVPGAFMSMLGMSLLNQIMADAQHDLEPGEVLNLLHAGVIQNLRQQEGAGQQDGMDIAMVAISKDHKQVRFAAANNPMYLVYQNELEEVKADKAPIGGASYADFKFKTLNIEVKRGQTLYLFSDGFADQFGGDKGRKYTYKRLKERILEWNERPLKTQAINFADELEAWKGSRPQLDDVLLMAVKL